MAHYTGILSVATLFDSLEARIPSDAEMKRAAMADDCASARLFMRVVDAFIEHILGIDIPSGQVKSEGGRFGRTKAYFGMVETQGRGTLHIHFLVWLSGAPINSNAFEENLRQRGDSFTADLEVYLDSIVTNQLQLPVGDVCCQMCRAQNAFESLPIPASARRGKRKRAPTDELEPLLVKCTACGMQSSSQHVLRQALMQHRPPHWPPPLTGLTMEDRLERIQRERPSRLSEQDAASRIDDREVFQAAIEASTADETGVWMLRMTDSPQQSYQHSESDPLYLDTINRLILMTPPTVDAKRMNSMHHAYMVSTLVYNLNMHYWTHTGSCFKQSRSTSNASVCRYGFPRKTATTSSVTGPSVTVKRPLAHEFVNGYNATIMAAFKCNHDVQVLFGGRDAINRIYYCCKYVTKPQRQIDTSTAVALASFQRRQAKEAVGLASLAPPSVEEIRRKRVTSMVHTFTNKQEIAGPLAALYLLRGSCCYSSANCVKLPFSDMLKQLEESGEYVCSLVQRPTTVDTVFTPASQLDDYIFRPASTSTLNLYEYTMKCYRRSISEATPNTRRYQASHPLAQSHCVAVRRIAAVPIIKGPRLPRFSTSMSQDEKELYGKLVLVLFKPFRELADLLGEASGHQNPWYTAYCAWEVSRTEFVKSIMNNMNDYHAGRVAEEQYVAMPTEIDDAGTGEPWSDSDNSSSDDGYVSEDNVDAEDDFEFPRAVDASDESSQVDDELPSFPAPTAFPPRISTVLEQFDDHHLLDGVAAHVAGVSGRGQPSLVVPLSVDELKKWVGDSATDNKSGRDQQDEASVGPLSFQQRQTTVTEIIDECLQPSSLSWCASPSSLPTMDHAPLYAGIGVLSRMFTLNELQHGAFSLIGAHLLRRWRFAEGDHFIPTDSNESPVGSRDTSLYNRQLRMFLGGEGGTGKSRVIQTLQELCRCWQRPHALVVTALTGKAASVVSGRTLASFEMSLKGTNRRIAVQDLDCLIIDEVSMMSKKDLLSLDRLLRKAKGVDGVAFGGIHVILVGDFLQLPPVGADPLFIDPITKQDASLADFEGFRLWRQFDKVVVLQESVRFRQDPEWGIGCSKARYGEWTPEFVAMINSRLASRQDQTHQPPPLHKNTIYVTPDNDTRTAINGHFMACVGRELRVGGFPIRIVANFKGALNNLNADDLRKVMGLPDTKFGRMAPYLDLVRGMPIQITQNVRTNKGVANGSMGVLHSVKFPPGTTFQQGRDRRTGVIFLIPSNRPLYALVQMDRGPSAIQIANDMDPALFPVFPDAEPFQAKTLRLTPSSTGDERLLSLKIQQFPFVCAVGATVYKVQGESLNSMVIIDWKVDLRGVNKPQQAYLMVSRVVTRQALVLLKALTPEIVAWAKPPQNAIDEDRRLIRESSRTLTQFFATQDKSQDQIGVPQ